jgi:3-dehydroquinate synthase
MARDHDVVSTMVGRCAEIKAEIVSDDETEQGRRAILNFGHTFAHALEREAGYAGITHGRAVALGMRAALHLSHLLHPEVDFHDAESLLHKLPSVRVDTPIDRLVSAMASDKKRVGRRLRFVILEEIGRAVVVPEVDVGDVTASWRAGLENQPE